MRTFVSAFGKTDSKHTRGAVVQLVRMPACHAGGRGFESLPHRKKSRSNPGLFAMWKERFCKLKNLQNEPSTVFGLGIFLDYRLREAVLVINVFGFCDFGSACGFSIHLQSGFQPLLYMPFFLMRNKGNDRTTEKTTGYLKFY